jgi:VCBS repeat-containing protein
MLDGDPQTLVVQLNGADDATVAVNDSVTVNDNQEPAVSTVSVLDNDSDRDENAILTVTGIKSGTGSGPFTPVGMGGASVTNFFGTLTMFADGSYEFMPNANAQTLNEADAFSFIFTYQVQDGTNPASTARLMVRLEGANDEAAIAGDISGMVTEDSGAGQTATGTLTSDDVDNPDNLFTVSSGSTDYGSYTMAANGMWTYTLDNDDPDVQALGAMGTLSDSFTVTSIDGTEQEIEIAIAGANDPASIAVVGMQDTEVTEAGGVANGDPGDPDAAGTLSVTDVDEGEDAFQAVDSGALQGVYGDFTFDETTGAWTYTLDEDLADSLAAGAVETDTLTVTSLDGTTYDIDVTVNGANDAPETTTNAGLTVAEGGMGAIGTFLLETTDVDNAAAELDYIISELPINGTLRFAGSEITSTGFTFTQADIDAGELEYLHDGSMTTADSFEFTVDDNDEDMSAPATQTFMITVDNMMV